MWIFMFFYFGSIIYLFLFACIKGLSNPIKRDGDNPTISDLLAKKAYFSPILIFFMLFLSLIILVLKLNFTILVKLFFPLLYGLFLYTALTWIFDVIVSNTSVEINFTTFGYITITLWAFIYAHTPFLKRLYISLLDFSKRMWTVEYFNEFIEKEKIRTRNSLFRLHIYLLLFVIYFFINISNFSGTLNKEHFSFITEALLTFVIIDTIMVLFRTKDDSKPSESTHK